MRYLSEPLPEFFSRSRELILNFADIPAGTPRTENIQSYFEEIEASGGDPREPRHRQAFNDRMLRTTGARYLVSRYGEDRQSMLAGSSIQQAGRTIHLGIDIFSQNLEPVLAPCDGTILRIGREPESHSFGHYLIFRPADRDVPWLFLGHLGANPPVKEAFRAGEVIAQLGDFHKGENGGWSRHLHFQLLAEAPAAGEVPLGYASRANFDELSRRYPAPGPYFRDLSFMADDGRLKDGR